MFKKWISQTKVIFANDIGRTDDAIDQKLVLMPIFSPFFSVTKDWVNRSQINK